MKRKKALSRILLIIAALVISQSSVFRVFASVDPSFMKTAAASKLDLRRYFEEAMFLFESGKYKEAVMLFEKLIEVEKANNEAYFTPFAEIYIEKSKTRMVELMIMEEKKWAKMKKDVVSEAEAIAKKESEKNIQEEEAKKKIKEDSKKKELYEKELEIKTVFENAVGYYKSKIILQAWLSLKR